MKKFLFCSLLSSLLLTTSAAFCEEVWDYKVTATKLDSSRNNLSPTTGSSSFSFKQQDIENLPQGQMTSLNQVLLRAPGVVQNSYGQIHVRGDHSNLQYRINGIIIPEGIAVFGQSFDTHFADSVNLLTGALPAQYGYRTAGVVDIKTKGGNFANGGRSALMVGGNNTLGANQQISGSKDKLNYYLSATYLQNDRGVESPTAARNSIHNETKQDKLFGYFSYLFDATTRLNFIVGNSNNRFQIPNNPSVDQSDNKTLNGSGNSYNVANLNERQYESNSYAIAALQGVSSSDIDYQISAFTRYSGMEFRSDHEGDLILNGVASNINRSSLMSGIQGDFGYQLNEKNTLRSGFYATNEANKNNNDNFVFPASGGTQSSTTPFLISDSGNKNSQFYSVYLQDELKLLEKLTLNFGARFDQSMSYKQERQLSPRFGAVYDATKNTKIHFGFSRYFTPPSAQLIPTTTLANYQDTTNAPSSLENDKVRAERTNYFDIGVLHKLNANFNIGVDAYYKRVRNLLDAGQFGNALIYTPFNYQKAEVYGAEFTSDFHKENFSSYFNFALQEAKAKNIISGQYLIDESDLEYARNNYVNPDHTQSYTASLGASYLFLKTRYSTDLIYGSGLRTGDSNKNTMPSYKQVNFSAARDFSIFGVNKFNIRLSVINLFDEVYQLHNGSGIGVAASQYGPRRTLYATLSKSF